MTAPLGFALYTALVLVAEGRVLLLERAPDKAFAPGRVTGVGGRVETDELGDLAAAALREVREETGLEPAAVRRLRLRRVLLHHRPGGPLTVLLFFSGELDRARPLTSPDGALRWLRPDEVAAQPLVDTAAGAIRGVLDDVAADPEGERGPRLGVANFDGGAVRVVWQDPWP